MRFLFTAEEAQPVAIAVSKYLQQKTMVVSVEIPAWDDAPYRTTLLARKKGMIVLVEAQGQFNYGHGLAAFASYLRAKRHYAEFYIATPAETYLPGAALPQLREDGVGWLLVHEGGNVTEQEEARNWALVISPDPTLSWGHCRTEVTATIKKFNEVNRKDGLRDLCEIFEREVESLAIQAARKGFLRVPEKNLPDMDLASKINTLASGKAYGVAIQPLVSEQLKADLHSFRTARNLVDHKVKGKREDKKRAMQFTDKMLQGSRLIAELVSLQSRLRRTQTDRRSA